MAVFNVHGGRGRDNITLQGTPGDDVFNVRGGPRGDNITIDGGGGNDVYNVRGGRGRDNVTIKNTPPPPPADTTKSTGEGSPTPSEPPQNTPAPAGGPGAPPPKTCGFDPDAQQMQALYQLLQADPQRFLAALQKIDPQRAEMIVEKLLQASGGNPAAGATAT